MYIYSEVRVTKLLFKALFKQENTTNF